MSDPIDAHSTNEPIYPPDLIASLAIASEGNRESNDETIGSASSSGADLSTQTNSGIDPAAELPKLTINGSSIDATDATVRSSIDELDLPESTADETLSPRAQSVASAADSNASVSSAIRSAQRNYLSPLRSKRYDGLRSSLLSPASSNSRPGYFNTHSRTASTASIKQLAELDDEITIGDTDETVKWSKLRKISAQLYNESGKKAFGTPTCCTISGVLAVGTSKGLVLIFDYQQVCRHVLGSGSEAIQSGAVTALALSADHTFIAVGHDHGAIFSWDLGKAGTPARSILPSELQASERKGHTRGERITFIDFVGTRHSAFVSADKKGMVFHHSFNRQLLFDTVTSTRILGRYPEITNHLGLKPSAAYASTVLPLGNVPDFTDTLGLVAILSPYKLVLVTTTPIARTQFKLNRPSGAIANTNTISGCAAWYPAFQESREAPSAGAIIRRPILAYAWSRQLQFLEVSQDLALATTPPEHSAVPKMIISTTKTYTSPESIVAMQWYSSSILTLCTSSSQLLLLDVDALKLIGHSDLPSKHIIHHDLYTDRLRVYFESREAEYVDQAFSHNYSHSLQIYKGKLFLLGNHDLYVGSLLSWADKLLALISAGQHIGAIELLMSYYCGSVELSSLRLPARADERKRKLTPKLQETMLSSIRFSLGSEDLSIRSDVYHEKLIETCLQACLLLQTPQFFLNDIYEEYEEVSRTEPFLRRLATSILNDHIVSVPPGIVQDLVKLFVQEDRHTRLEDIICHLDPAALDINQILLLCRENKLYNALTYVYTEALKDFIGPMAEFIGLIKKILRTTQVNAMTTAYADLPDLGADTVNAVKVFSYISLTMTGRTFPLARDRESVCASFGKAQLSQMLFSGSTIRWPTATNELSTVTDEEQDPTFPYLRLLLLFDCPTFLACMDEAFEDPYFNETLDDSHQLSRGSMIVNRQFMVNVLLDVMSSDFEKDDIIYLYMFIARNVPKYPQFILLSGSVLQSIITGLCDYPDIELAEDCQLSVEYLLSIYKPSDSVNMLNQFRQAGFYRVLKSLYRAEGRWADLLLAELKDEESGTQALDRILELLGPDSSLSEKEQSAVRQVVLDEIVPIASLDGSEAARVIESTVPELQLSIIKALNTRDGLLYIYLKRVMGFQSSSKWITPAVRARYIDLLCVYDRNFLLEYLQGLRTDDINIQTVIGNLEQYNLTDAIVHLMSGQGLRRDALQKVIGQLSLLENKVPEDSPDFMTQLAKYQEDFDKYSILGANLCEAETVAGRVARPTHSKSTDVVSHEQLWVDLITAIVNSYSTSTIFEWCGKSAKVQRVQLSLQNTVQTVLARLIDSTYAQAPMSTVNTLRMWIQGLHSSSRRPDMIKSILPEIFSSYHYYYQLLALAQSVFGDDLFSEFAAGVTSRNRGWRVTVHECNICRQPLPASVRLSVQIKELKAATRLERREEKRTAVERHHGIIRHNAGKGPADLTMNLSGTRQYARQQDENDGETNLLSFACGHLCHETCYQPLHADSGLDAISCPSCLVDSTRQPDPFDASGAGERLVPSRY